MLQKVKLGVVSYIKNQLKTTEFQKGKGGDSKQKAFGMRNAGRGEEKQTQNFLFGNGNLVEKGERRDKPRTQDSN